MSDTVHVGQVRPAPPAAPRNLWVATLVVLAIVTGTMTGTLLLPPAIGSAGGAPGALLGPTG